MNRVAMHEDQLRVDNDLARRLIYEQFPDWSALDVRSVPTAGTVNAIFRVGESMTARFPLRAADPAEVRRWLWQESEAAREFATISTVPCPEPIALGEPALGYPLPWSVQTWVPGCDAVSQDPAGSEAFVEDLAGLVGRLRAAPTRGRRFTGTGRGGHLSDHDEWMALCFDMSHGLVDVQRLRALWQELRGLPEVDNDVMSHGDLTPPNVLVNAGRLAGVLDTGGFAAADPALDLVGVWHLLDHRQRGLFREVLPCGEVQWRRGMAWALQQAMGLVWYYAESNPVMSRWGKRTLDRLLAAM
jgi:aminoglycoside phosphotransferase (APT) family kinase protein